MQPFGLPLAIVLNDLIGQRQRAGRTAEILIHDIGLRLIAFREVKDKVGVRPAPLIHRLVVVANGHIIAMLLGEQIQHFSLSIIDVLELIHQDVPVAALYLR